MLTIEEIRKKLKDRRISVVQRECNLSYFQVYGISSGKVAHPSYEVVKALSDYLEDGKKIEGGNG